MEFLDTDEGFAQIDALGARGEPFLFVVSYDKSQIYAKPLDKLDNQIYYSIDGNTNRKPTTINHKYTLHKIPIPYTTYKKSLDRVIEQIQEGNTYLLNLTFETPIDTDLTLLDIYDRADAKYKLYIGDIFVCFSPESFIEIEGNRVSTYPMKGTIDADILNAKEQILSNPKELAEHTMIVDLMRNDLGIIATDITVEKFRYVEQIRAGEKNLLQVSSQISANMPKDWQKHIGTTLSQILPAGSISGTPKRSTMDIISEIEDYSRGFYTGVFGIYDGESLYSAVMIRYIEQKSDRLVYKSGGGITIDSNPKSEYDEMVDKIYI